MEEKVCKDCIRIIKAGIEKMRNEYEEDFAEEQFHDLILYVQS